jgi:DNA polymerase I-like protein with 3'-5' exonuclease and polymerase domains
LGGGYNVGALTVKVGDLPDFVTKPDPEIYQNGKPLFVDFETTNLNKGSSRTKQNRIVLACWQEGWYGPVKHKWGGEYDQQDLLDAISRSDFIVAHNAKFELGWLERCGIDLSSILVYDTMLAEYVIGGNRWKTGQLSLDVVSKRYSVGTKGTTVSKLIKAGVPTEEIPQEWLLKYCQQDVSLLPDIMSKQLSGMSGTRLLPVVYSRCLLTPVLSDLEKNGMRLDGGPILQLAASLEASLEDAERKANVLAEGVNLNSPKQLAAFLYDQLGFSEPTIKRGRKTLPDRTPSGGRKTDSDTIAGLECRTDRQREFKALFEEAREYNGQLTKYLRKFVECINDNEGMLYANFNQTQTATHRLSSSGAEYAVQFQNQPRAYKKFFRASVDDWLVGEVDGAQLEFRGAGHLGRDECVRNDVTNGVDVHSKTAAKLTEAGQETDRQVAKTHTFKPLYGGSSGTEAEQAYYLAFREWYPGVAAAQQRWINDVLLSKKLETEWGLVFYWPDTRMTESGYITNTPSICNYPVQSFCTAEIIPLALVCMWHRLRRMENVLMRLVNTVHDSIVAEFPPEEADLFHALSVQCMKEDATEMVRKLYGIELFVPLGCGVKIGDRWGSGKETKY